MMNNKARMLKMRHTTYYNPHGLPGRNGNPDNTSTMADLVRLVEAVFETRQIIFTWTSRSSIKLPVGHPRAVQVNSTNRLIGMRGVTGLKTGFTNAAGRCLIITCKRDGRTFVGIATGCTSSSNRDSFCRSLLLWGFKAIKSY